jgi:hypothetical protein
LIRATESDADVDRRLAIRNERFGYTPLPDLLRWDGPCSS